MIASPQLKSLQDYTQALEKENQAKKAEQIILYRQLENMANQINQMEQYYYQNRELQKYIQDLKGQLLQKNEQFKYATATLEKSQGSLLIKLGEIQAELIQKNSSIFELKQQITHISHRQRIMNEQIVKHKAALNEQRQQNEQLLQQIQYKDQHINELDTRIKELQSAQESLDQPDIDSLIQNYQQIETIVIEKQDQIEQMEKQIDQLNYRCSMQVEEIKLKQTHFKKLQSKIQDLKQSSKVSHKLGESQQICQQLRAFSKIDLIKNSNKMIQRICSLEKENNSYALNLSDDSNECTGKSVSLSSHNQLQMKIQALKMQNQKLIQNLVI